MRQLILALALLIAGTSAAYALCTTNTIYGPNGRVTMCTTCCYGTSCTTTCY